VILVYAIILLIILALITGRDLSAIGQISYRGGWRLGAIVASLFLLQAAFVLYVPGQTIIQMLLVIFSQLALIFLVWLNRHVPGAKLFALGVMLNTTVMVANGGWMPITPETYESMRANRTVEVETRAPGSKGIMLPRSETRFWILSDIIRVDLPGRRSAMSIGDILLIIGAAQFLFQGTPRADTPFGRWSGS
jgi:hypothetical protein